MDKFKPLLLLVGAFVLAGIAAWGSISYLNDKEESIRASLQDQQNLVSVVVAKRDLDVGELISAETVALRSIPAGYIPDGAIYPDDFDLVAGLNLNEPVSIGKPLMRHQLKGLSGVGSFSQLLKVGQRAVTLETDNLSSNEGMIETGDYIDLVLLVSHDDQPVVFEPLLDNLMVLATGQKTVADPEYVDEDGNMIYLAYQSFTLGVDVEDVPKVYAARQKGELLFLLRNPDDKKRSRYSAGQLTDNIDIVENLVGGQASNGVLTTQHAGVISGDHAYWESQLVEAEKKYQKFKRVVPDRDVKKVVKVDTENSSS